MESIVATQTFASDLAAMVAFTRTLESRSLWPGSTPDRAEQDTLYYFVSMQLDGAPVSQLHVSEAMSPVERRGDGEVHFSAEMRTSWATGHSDVEIEYLFTPGSGGAPNSLQYTYRYNMPDTSLLTSEQHADFHAGLGWVSRTYVKGLVERAPSAAQVHAVGALGERCTESQAAGRSAGSSPVVTYPPLTPR